MEYFLIILVIILAWFIISGKKEKNNILSHFPDEFRNILQLNSKFYNQLSIEEKSVFEERILNFLNTTKITGVDTDVKDIDKVLVATSAIIPVFAYPDWEYINLNEVLLYPTSFNEKFETNIGGSVQGMVGTGYMEGKMILSKPALLAGFKNENDKKNVGIHEFVHLVDKSDGAADGIPEVLLNKQYAIPWIDLVQKEMEKIHELQSDINPYGGINKTEFFAVIAEYFFEKPKLLKTKHPEIYNYLEKIFTTDLSKKYKKERKKSKPNRNDPCICGSGKKYKYCCGKYQ